MVALHGLCIERKAGLFAPVFELVEGVPLDAFMQQSIRLKAAVRHRLIMDVGSALFYLHDHQPPITHGHLDGSNVAVESRLAGPRAKLLDCGWSAVLEKQSCIELVSPFDFGRRSTPALWKIMRHRLARQRKILVWTAPEALSMQEAAFTPSADVFVFGRLMYMVVTGIEPLKGVEVKVMEKAVQKRAVLPLDWPETNADVGERVVMEKLFIRCRSLVERCCIPNPLLRPSMSGVFGDVKQWVPSATNNDLPLFESCSNVFDQKKQTGGTGDSSGNDSELWMKPTLTSLSEAVTARGAIPPSCPQCQIPLRSWATVQAEESSNCNFCDRRLALGCEAWWRCIECGLDMCVLCEKKAVPPDAKRAGPFFAAV
jgi:serine/threonine protein kinase